MFCLIFHNCSRSVRYTAYGTYYPCQYLRTGKSGDTWHMSYGTNNQSTAEWRSASHTNLTLGKQERTRSHRCTNGLNYRMDIASDLATRADAVTCKSGLVVERLFLGTSSVAISGREEMSTPSSSIVVTEEWKTVDTYYSRCRGMNHIQQFGNTIQKFIAKGNNQKTKTGNYLNRNEDDRLY